MPILNGNFFFYKHLQKRALACIKNNGNEFTWRNRNNIVSHSEKNIISNVQKTNLSTSYQLQHLQDSYIAYIYIYIYLIFR